LTIALSAPVALREVSFRFDPYVPGESRRDTDAIPNEVRVATDDGQAATTSPGEHLEGTIALRGSMVRTLTIVFVEGAIRSDHACIADIRLNAQTRVTVVTDVGGDALHALPTAVSELADALGGCDPRGFARMVAMPIVIRRLGWNERGVFTPELLTATTTIDLSTECIARRLPRLAIDSLATAGSSAPGEVTLHTTKSPAGESWTDDVTLRWIGTRWRAVGFRIMHSPTAMIERVNPD
jgi:hypothetical protein